MQVIDESMEPANSSIDSVHVVGINNDDNNNSGGAIGKHAMHTTWTLLRAFYNCRYVAAKEFGILEFHRGHQKHTFFTYHRQVVSAARERESAADTARRNGNVVFASAYYLT